MTDDQSRERALSFVKTRIHGDHPSTFLKNCRAELKRSLDEVYGIQREGPFAITAEAGDYSIEPSPDQAQPAPSAGPAMTVAVGGAGRPFQALADVNVRQGPGNAYPRVATLPVGSTAMVTSERLGWLEIRLEGGTGWVYRKWLRDLGAAGAAPP